MPWIKKHGIKGLVFIPDQPRAGTKKHECQDCFHCQMCSDIRCEECQNSKQSCTKKKYINKKH